MSTVVNQVTIKRGLRAAFMKAFDNGEDPQDVMPFIMDTNSDGPDEEYGWLGQSPSLTEWIDERKLKALSEFEYKIPNKHYEGTLQVDRNSLKDDRMGAVQTRINDLASKARIHPRKLFFEALVAGETDLGYDGQPFFSASHKDSDLSGTQSNLNTGTGTTLAQIEADFEKAETDMKCFLDDTGEPMNEGEIKIGIVCHATLKQKFVKLNTLSLINNSENGLKGRIATITDSCRLGTTSAAKNSWYFADTGEGMKPIIRQKRQDPEFNALEGDSDNGFMRRQFAYGIDYRVGFGYGLWQKMIKVKNT